MALNRVKLGRAVTFMKYPTGVIFLLKILIWNKITFPASDLINFTGLMKNLSKKIYQYSFFCPICRYLL